MPPPIEGFDPWKGVKGIEQTGEDISQILAEANKAEAGLRQQKMAQKGAEYLHAVITHRSIGKGTPDNPEKPEVGFAPFLDPVVQQAALAVSPISRDYVTLLKGISDQNVKILEPKVTSQGTVQYDPKKGQFVTTKKTNITTAEIISPGKDGQPHKIQVATDKDSGTELWRKDLGVNYEKPPAFSLDQPGTTLDPQTIDYYARLVAVDPKNMPTFGFGPSAQKARVQLLNASVKYAANDPAGILVRRQALTANQTALTQTTKSLAAVKTFEQTAQKNLQIFVEQAKKVVDAGSPWINLPLREVEVSGLGSPEVAAYKAARTVAINEIARVVSNPNLTGILSDAARQEVENFNPLSATLAQTYAVVDVLQRDMANRIGSLEATRDELTKSVRDLSTVATPDTSKNDQPSKFKIIEVK